MLGWYEDEQYIYIAMEYYQHGNLRDFVLNSPIQSESWARDVIRQILGVLVELTASQLTHRNITPSVSLSAVPKTQLLTSHQNILIATTLPIRVKLGDFHNAKFLFEEDGLRTQVGTLPYIAPEMRGLLNHDHKLSHSYDTKVDMWALGIILHEMLTKMHPFREPGRSRFSEGQYQRFLRQDQPVSLNALQGKASVHAMSFVACMLARDPNLRPTPAGALCVPWFMQPVLPV